MMLCVRRVHCPGECIRNCSLIGASGLQLLLHLALMMLAMPLRLVDHRLTANSSQHPESKMLHISLLVLFLVILLLFLFSFLLPNPFSAFFHLLFLPARLRCAFSLVEALYKSSCRRRLFLFLFLLLLLSTTSSFISSFPLLSTLLFVSFVSYIFRILFFSCFTFCSFSSCSPSFLRTS